MFGFQLEMHFLFNFTRKIKVKCDGFWGTVCRWLVHQTSVLCYSLFYPTKPQGTKEMDDNQIDNEEKTWGFHINSTDRCTDPKCPDWANLPAKHKWEKMGIILWNKVDVRIIHLWPHQALDVLDDFYESSSWRNEGLLLSWNSYSLPISEKDRRTRRFTENRRNKFNDGKLNQSEMYLSPIQAQEFFIFLESHHEDISRMADERSMEAKKMLGRVYALILSWRRERMQRISNASEEKRIASG
jgi:hypothetical protein